MLVSVLTAALTAAELTAVVLQTAVLEADAGGSAGS